MNRNISISYGGLREAFANEEKGRKFKFVSEPFINTDRLGAPQQSRYRSRYAKPSFIVKHRRRTALKSSKDRRRRKLGSNLIEASKYADILQRFAIIQEQNGKTTEQDEENPQVLRRNSSGAAEKQNEVPDRSPIVTHWPNNTANTCKRLSHSLKIQRWVAAQKSNRSWCESDNRNRRPLGSKNNVKVHPITIAKAAAQFKDLTKPINQKLKIEVESAAKRRQQWISNFTSSSISSESTCCDDLSMADIDIKPHSEIFDCLNNPKVTKERRLNAIKDKLSSKGQSYEVIDLLSAKNEKELLNLIHSRHTRVILDVCLLWSCIHGDKSLIAYFLKLGANPEASDAEGFSAMHLVAENNSGEAVDTLFLGGARVCGTAIWDNKREFTPLMLAARAGNLEAIEVLISRGADLNINVNSSKEMALHFAVRNRHNDCVKFFLSCGAVANPLHLYSETPLHIAVYEDFPELVEMLLEAGADVRASKGVSKMAALHLAAQEGHHFIAKMLLKAGADHKQLNSRGQTALHIAARAQSADTVQELLNCGANPNAKDYDGKTPLHAGIFKGSRCYECLKQLIEANADPNAADTAGYTPLHLAALNESSYCVQMFLKHGGDVSARTKGGISALNIILRKTPLGLTCLQDILDSSIAQEDRDHHREGEGRMQLDFRIFKGEKGREPECRLLTCFVKERQKLLLKHPLCESFLYLKWQQVRSFFVVNIIYYSILVLTLTMFIHHTFPGTCFCEILIFRNSENSTNPQCPISHYHENISSNSSIHTEENTGQMRFVFIYLIWLLVCLLSCKESIQFIDTPKSYIASLDNILIWPIICFSFIITISGYLHDTRSEWEYHIAAYLILLSWVELLLLVGRFPLCGLYVQMFARVIQNFGKFLLTYICLINAFSLSFGVLFHNHSAFKCHLIRLLKTLVMMTGEVEYDDFFFDDPEILYPGTAHLIFALFLLFCTIILMNLLVGLAVSDIQGLQQSAGLDRLVRQTELIASLELILFSRWLAMTVPPSLLKIIRNRVLLLPTIYGSKLTLATKNINGYKLDNELLESIHRTARARDHGSRRKNAFASFRSMSHAAQYGSEGETARGIEAVHCGLELLVRESETRKVEAKQMKESLINILQQLDELLIRTSKLENEDESMDDCSDLNDE